MSRALISFLIAFCFLAQGYGATPEEEEPCDNCASLDEEKAEASATVNKAFDEGMEKLNMVREDGEKTRRKIMVDSMSEVDNIITRELRNVVNEGNKAFEEALKQGKDVSVMDCIIGCEINAQKEFTEKRDKFKNDLKAPQEQPLKSIDDTLSKVTEIENKLKGMRDGYIKKIKSTTMVSLVNYHKNSALKDFGKTLKGSENLGEEFPKILNDYKESVKGILSNCEATFIQLGEVAKQCMKGCLESF